MPMITHPTTTPTAPGRAGVRAPYQVGDHVRALYSGPAGGTCLALAAPVLAVAGPSPQRTIHPWAVVYAVGDVLRESAWVDAAGLDAHDHVAPSVSVLAPHEAATPAGAFALTLARVLRRARVVGPLAQWSPDAHALVCTTWASGRTRLRVLVEAHDGLATFHITAYPDTEHPEPTAQVEARTVPAALGAIARILHRT